MTSYATCIEIESSCLKSVIEIRLKLNGTSKIKKISAYCYKRSQLKFYDQNNDIKDPEKYFRRDPNTFNTFKLMMLQRGLFNNFIAESCDNKFEKKMAQGSSSEKAKPTGGRPKIINYN